MNPKDLNLAVRFLLELATLAALGYWGFSSSGSAAGRLALGIGAPLAAALLWGIFVSPRAQVELPYGLRMGLGLAIMGSGVVALAAAGRPRLAVLFSVVVVVNTALVAIWRQ